ncbi:MAG: hypothetical protein COS14_00470 [Bacteroidetes bacterium CG02_land_8_20_14_3_00_31_25]|nr:MAG: hypothetical protein COS14_00470 [Bacteroidetes bacterium CG02_land_8_20_14_3_00_31_25]PIX35154.1 MAG: hypothetical protein COZ59_06865 [Bacteroidetes bacterium CG_4_8_14_3_um_filter_31_14]
MVLRIKNNCFSSNTYLIIDDDTKHCLIIDPGLNELVIDNEIQELHLKPVAILCTHGHFDHIGGVSYFKEKFEIPFYIHKADLKLMKSANLLLKLGKINKFIKISIPDVLFIESYSAIIISDFYLEIYNLPGHTEGSCIIQYKDNIFTGDTIFKDGLYINKLPGENVEALKKSIREIFEIFDLNINCFPGHGPDAILDHIKSKNLDLIKFLNN